MTKKRPDKQNPEIRAFILSNVSNYPNNIASVAAGHFGISRQAINRYLKRLISEKLIKASGKTRDRKYELRKLVNLSFVVELSPGISEDAVWRFRILPKIKDLPKNIIDLCHYGFTEILNNAIDHSGGSGAIIRFVQTYAGVEFSISDNGIGIFEKLKKDFNLPDNQAALLELSKGRITSNPKAHAGEGIFFTSRMFDKFVLLSKGTFYLRERKVDDGWLIEAGENEKPTPGTLVQMEISRKATWTPREVFEKYSQDQQGFRKTHVPIKIGLYPGEELVSRSQAKRILSRFDQFSEIMLDFEGVENIGQPFADEIFRVFKSANPNIQILTFNTTPPINKIIKFVQKEEK